MTARRQVEFVQTAWPQLMKDFESDNSKGNADLMMTDSSETRYQQKQHPGVLCAVHPDKPFDFAEKAYWLQRDMARRPLSINGCTSPPRTASFKKIYAAWFD
jgi:cyclohexadienyl dehydratase